ncbi:MAG TPA: radical SAM protein, partial [Clostridia bacterium]|nr:radical SAM protein [Clostridia bacterium]
MRATKSVFGPVPSRRLGLSLGISPLPRKTCNYACVYCQLGRTRQMTNQRQEFVPWETIREEFSNFLQSGVPFDVVTIVGEGEPTLY